MDSRNSFTHVHPAPGRLDIAFKPRSSFISRAKADFLALESVKNNIKRVV